LQYPILESAITGRIGVEDVSADNGDHRPSSLLDSAKMDDNELSKLRTAVMEREGLIVSIFELLRIIPRRLLMILKLSDLQRYVLACSCSVCADKRSLDFSLATTHGQSRIFLIVAQYCAKAGKYKPLPYLSS